MNEFYKCININQDGILYMFLKKKNIQTSEKYEPQSQFFQLTHTNHLLSFI